MLSWRFGVLSKDNRRIGNAVTMSSSPPIAGFLFRTAYLTSGSIILQSINVTSGDRAHIIVLVARPT
jgi:hypothetical protein